METPNSKESEMMVLGCMLISINALNSAADMLDPSEFFYTEHQTIFHTLKEAYKLDKPVDAFLICEELKNQNKLESVGGPAYIATLVQYAGISTNIEEYSKIVHDKSLLRRLISTAQTVEKKSFEGREDVYEIIDEAQQLFFQIGHANRSNSGTLVKDILSGVSSESGTPFLKEVQQKQEEYLKHGPMNQFAGVRTHFVDLDRMLHGLGKSNLIILAARPSMGKTAFALNIAENACFKSDIPVGFFSLEMSAEQLVHRMLCSQAEVESDKIKTGAINGMEFQRIVEAHHTIQKNIFLIEDQPGLKISDIRSRARRMKEKYGIGLLVIDYLQLITGTGSYRSQESRQLEISEISRLLKNLARELNIPILCLSQLSRKVEERTNHVPMMSDIRESGSIEQDSDVIILLLREEYYDPKESPGLARLIIAKNRHGGIGEVNFAFRKEIAQFANIEREE